MGRRLSGRRRRRCRMVSRVQDRCCSNEHEYEARQHDGRREDPASPILFVLLCGCGTSGSEPGPGSSADVVSPSCSHSSASSETAGLGLRGGIGKRFDRLH